MKTRMSPLGLTRQHRSPTPQQEHEGKPRTERRVRDPLKQRRVPARAAGTGRDIYWKQLGDRCGIGLQLTPPRTQVSSGDEPRETSSQESPGASECQDRSSSRNLQVPHYPASPPEQTIGLFRYFPPVLHMAPK